MRPSARIHYLFYFLLIQSFPGYAGEPDTRFSFASVTEGVQLLRTRDEFIERLSPFDRMARVRTDRDVTEGEFLDHVAKSVQPWKANERKKIEAVLADLRPRIAALSLRLPATIHLIKTSGAEEGEAAYTRGNAIVIPAILLLAPPDELARLISHEIFHILMRQHGELRDRLYRVIGFEKGNEIVLPPALERKKITNPDAPRIDVRIRVRLGQEPVWAVPVLVADSDRYDTRRGGLFFDYLRFGFLLVEPSGPRGEMKPVMHDGMPRLVGLPQISGFFEQVGRNTRYIFHPEEILADNFALLVLGKKNVPNPEILNRLREILGQTGRTPPGSK